MPCADPLADKLLVTRTAFPTVPAFTTRAPLCDVQPRITGTITVTSGGISAVATVGFVDSDGEMLVDSDGQELVDAT